MAEFIGLGYDFAGAAIYTGADPVSGTHGQLKTNGGHTINFGNNKLALAAIDTPGATQLAIGSVNASDVLIGVDGRNTVIKGNLTVEGTTFTTESETVLINDNYLYLNNGYNTPAAVERGGNVINYEPLAANDTVAATGFVAGVGAVEAFVTTVGSATFAVGQLIQVTGSNLNDGLYEVLAHVGTKLEIRTVGAAVVPVEDFTQNDFTTDTTVAGTIRQVTVAVQRVADGTGTTTKGDWEAGKGSSTPLTFTAFSIGVPSLDSVYTSGGDNTVPITDAAGTIAFTNSKTDNIGMNFDTSLKLTFGALDTGYLYSTSSTFLLGTDNLSSATASMYIKCGSVDRFGGAASSGAFFVGSGDVGDFNQAGGTGHTGNVIQQSGTQFNTALNSGTTGGVILRSGGIVNSTGDTGAAQVETGPVEAGGGSSGPMQFYSGYVTAGSGNTGSIAIFSGNANGTGSSGNVRLSTGSSVSGSKGIIDIDGTRMEFDAHNNNIGLKLPTITTGDPSDQTGTSAGDIVIRTDAGNEGIWIRTVTQWEEVTFGAVGNTLDQAYDQGGAGAGRVITADSGPVEINNDGLRLVDNSGVTFGTSDDWSLGFNATDLQFGSSLSVANDTAAGDFDITGMTGGAGVAGQAGRGSYFTVAAGTGGASTFQNAGLGGDVEIASGAGGGTTLAAGLGGGAGAIDLTGGLGGAGGTTGGQGGSGGSINLLAGNGSATGTTKGGAGSISINAGVDGAAAVKGDIDIGQTNAEDITLGNATDNTTLTMPGTGVITIGQRAFSMVDNVQTALSFIEPGSSDPILRLGTLNATPMVNVPTGTYMTWGINSLSSTTDEVYYCAEAGGDFVFSGLKGIPDTAAGDTTFTAAAGGNASAGAAGAGGDYTVLGGVGGDGTAALANGSGGDIHIRGGAPGAVSGGPGGGIDGDVYIGDADTTLIDVGNVTDDPVITCYNMVHIDADLVQTAAVDEAYWRIGSRDETNIVYGYCNYHVGLQKAADAGVTKGFFEYINYVDGTTTPEHTEVHLGMWDSNGTDAYRSAMVYNGNTGVVDTSVMWRHQPGTGFFEIAPLQNAADFNGIKCIDDLGLGVSSFNIETGGRSSTANDTGALGFLTGEITGTGTGDSGDLEMATGTIDTTVASASDTGTVDINSGNTSVTLAHSGATGNVQIASGSHLSTAATGGTGAVTITSGGTLGSGATGNTFILTGNTASGTSGTIRMQTGTGTTKGVIDIDTTRMEFSAHALNVGLRVPTWGTTGNPSAQTTTEEGDIVVNTVDDSFQYFASAAWHTVSVGSASMQASYTGGAGIALTVTKPIAITGTSGWEAMTFGDGLITAWGTDSDGEVQFNGTHFDFRSANHATVATAPVRLYSGNYTGAGAVNSGDVSITSGSASAGTGDSGDITVKTGVGGTARGKIVLDGEHIEIGTTLVTGGLRIYAKNGVPAAEAYGTGSMIIDYANGVLYINQGTSGSPTWVKVGSQS